MHSAMVRELKFGRTVHSLSSQLCMYKGVSFTLVSPKELSMPDYVIGDIENAGQKITITDQLEDNLDQTDILYLTRIQEELFPSQEKSNNIAISSILIAIFTHSIASQTL